MVFNFNEVVSLNVLLSSVLFSNVSESTSSENGGSGKICVDGSLLTGLLLVHLDISRLGIGTVTSVSLVLALLLKSTLVSVFGGLPGGVSVPLAVQVGNTLGHVCDGRIHELSSAVADVEGGGVVDHVLVDRLGSVLDDARGRVASVDAGGSLVLGVVRGSSGGVVVGVGALVSGGGSSVVNSLGLGISVCFLNGAGVVHFRGFGGGGVLVWLLNGTVVGHGGGCVRLFGVGEGGNEAKSYNG